MIVPLLMFKLWSVKLLPSANVTVPL